MQDLRSYFPGCKLDTEEIRSVIMKILKTDNEESFCFHCFALITKTPETKQICPTCFRVYCIGCCHRYYKHPQDDQVIDTYKCIQCVDTRRYPYY